MPLRWSTDRYILVTPRVLRVGTPENIHVQAHSDSRQPLTGTLKVNLTVWDFPMKRTMLARSQLLLLPENHFMNQASVMVGDRPGWGPQREALGQQQRWRGADCRGTSHKRHWGGGRAWLYVLLLSRPAHLEIQSPLSLASRKGCD